MFHFSAAVFKQVSVKTNASAALTRTKATVVRRAAAGRLAAASIGETTERAASNVIDAIVMHQVTHRLAGAEKEARLAMQQKEAATALPAAARRGLASLGMDPLLVRDAPLLMIRRALATNKSVKAAKAIH